MSSLQQHLIDFYDYIAQKRGCIAEELQNDLPKNVYANLVAGILLKPTDGYIPDITGLDVIRGIAPDGTQLTPCGKNFMVLSKAGWENFQELAPDIAALYDQHEPTTEEMYALIASSKSKMMHIDHLYCKFGKYTGGLMAELIRERKIVERKIDEERIFSIVK